MKPSYVELHDVEFVSVKGAENRQFLQGQLSCNLDLLSPECSLRGALCNLKGRVIADLRVLLHGDEILLQASKGMAAIILNTLGKYAVFSKVELLEHPAPPLCIGLAGVTSTEWAKGLLPELPNTRDAVTADRTSSILCIEQGTRHELWIHDPDQAKTVKQVLSQALQALPITTWIRQQILNGEIHVTAELSEIYTPQLLNYDISGVIDFEKGCYTGQEVVARMYYRGKAKKRLFLLQGSTDTRTGVSITDASGKQVGEVVICNSDDDRIVLLAVVNVEATEGEGDLSLATESGEVLTQLEVQTLPY